MRHSIRWLVLAALTLVAAFPLWSTADFWSSYDGLLHLYRAFALDQTLRQGVVYPRWVLDLAYGYGYPIFDFYPPLAAYISEALHLLGLGFPEAIKGTFIAIIAIAVVGAYRMGLEFFHDEPNSELAGLLTATAYVFFPYFFVDVYVRGAVAEALAAALLPWLVLSLHRTLALQTTGSLVVTALFLALVIFSHSLTAVIAAPFLAALVLFETFRLPPLRRIQAIAGAGLATLIGLGLVAFYWVPFVLELPLVRMGRGLDVIAEVFQTNFLAPSALVQSSWAFSYGAVPVALGLVASLLGADVLALTILTRRTGSARSTVLFFGAVAIAGALAMTEPARGVWLAFPASTLIQSVWRVSVLIDLGLAVVVGSIPILFRSAAQSNFAVGNRWAGGIARVLPTTIVAPVLIMAAMARLSPEALPLPSGEFTLGRLARFEVFSANLGTTIWGEYLPNTVAAPDLVDYHAGDQPGASDSPRIELTRRSGTQWGLRVSTASRVSVSFRTLYFPDWQATLDGKPVPTFSSTPMGLLTVDVPVGEHQVVLSQEDTFPRRAGALISALAALVMITILVQSICRRETDGRMSLVVLALVCLVMALPNAVALASSPAQYQPMQKSITPGFELIAIRIDDARFERDRWVIPGARDLVHLTAYWHVKRSGLEDEPIAWRLVDGAGQVRAQRLQMPRYGTAPQHTWVRDEIIEDRYDVPLPADMPAGAYTLEVSNGIGHAPRYVPVAMMEMEHGGAYVTSSPPVQSPIDARLGDQIRLLGFAADPTAHAGERYGVTLYWQAQQDILEDYAVSTQLLDSEGRLVVQHDNPPGEGLYPTSLWLPGETIKDQRSLVLPRDLRPGVYKLIAVMYRPRDMQRLPVVTKDGPAPDNAIPLGTVEIRPLP